MSATITILPIIARPTAWQGPSASEEEIGRGAGNVVWLPVIRIERFPDDDDEPGRRGRAHRKRRSEHAGSSE